MSKLEDSRRYKWTNPATNLLVSIWCHDLVQNHLKSSSRNRSIWESIARYMWRRGFTVSGLQCKTRIRNMLRIYQEAITKNDPSNIEPYYEIFKKVLDDKGTKKKDLKSTKVKQDQYSVETDDDSVSLDSTQSSNQNTSDCEYPMEFLDVNNQNHQISKEILKEFEKNILKVVNSRTKAITRIIKTQCAIFEKVLVAERKKMEVMLTSEREYRKQLESRLDRLLSKFEVGNLPQGNLVDTVNNASQS